MIKKIEKKIADRVASNTRTIFIVGLVLLVITTFVPRFGSHSDEATARAVASLLARTAISDDDLSVAMEIPGVRDAFIVRSDGFIKLPSRRRGYAAHLDSDAATIVSLNEGERIVVEASKGARPPQMPLFLLIPFAVGGALLIARKRSTACHDRDDEGAGNDIRACDFIGIELASRVADASLVRIDKGCRVIAASERAQRDYGISASSGHIVDILRPEEVQSVLQLIRRSDRADVVSEDVLWRGGPAHVSVIKDGDGFLVKLTRRCRDE